MKCFGWLHLTDLHQDMKEQHWLWSGVRHIFFNDLKRLHEKCGPWDLVLFTGDLTQRGSEEEFKKVDDILEELWEKFKELGSSDPHFLAVPGNHDLVRPAKKTAAVRALIKWEEDAEIRKEFWDDAQSEYRQVITKAFKNYIAWWEKQTLKVKDINPGILPGDFSVTIGKDGAKLGLVGLNTSFLQLTDDNYEGKLALHARQFHGACDGDGSAWAKQHHACLLLTHHPPVWLNPDSRKHLDGEIAAHGRFVVHLCGHMHETVYREIAEGGVETRRIWQGRSLFGLEYFGKENEGQRLHGYTAGRIELSGDTGTLLFWPRKDELQGGQRSIVPDYSVKLTDNQHTYPKDFELLQPYKSHSIREGLGVLIELMQSSKVRSTVVAYQTDFQGVREQIDILGDYKDLHDVLHDFQFLCYNPIVLEAKRFPEDEIAMVNLSYHYDSFLIYIDKLREIAKRMSHSSKETEWIQRLVKASEELRGSTRFKLTEQSLENLRNEGIPNEILESLKPLQDQEFTGKDEFLEAVKKQIEQDQSDKYEGLILKHAENSNVEHLNKAVLLTHRVLATVPSRINNRLVDAARTLRMAALVKAMTFVRDQLTSLDLAPENIENVQLFEAYVDDLDSKSRKLTALINEHDEWQRVDDELRREANIEQDISKLRWTWPMIKEIIEPLYLGRKDDWAVSLKENGEKLDSAIEAKALAKIKMYFRDYQRKVSECFYRVDSELKKLCDDLRKVGEELDSLIKKMEEG